MCGDMEQYKKNDVITVTIEDMGHDGEGIGKINGFPLFIKDAVIGDTVLAKIMKSKKNYAYARLLDKLGEERILSREEELAADAARQLSDLREEVASEAVADYFSGKGWSVKTASDGMEALALFEQSSFHLVLLDVMMPRRQFKCKKVFDCRTFYKVYGSSVTELRGKPQSSFPTSE